MMSDDNLFDNIEVYLEQEQFRKNVTLLQFVATRDREALAELLTAVAGNPVPLVRIKMLLNTPFELRRIWLAAAPNGRIIGYNMLLRQVTYPSGEVQLMLGVHPAWRRQGIGQQLYNDAEGFARAAGYRRISVTVDDDLADSLTFAQRQGFEIVSHQYPSVLDLAAFVDGPFVKYLTAAKLKGIRFFSLAQLGDTAANRRKFYELHRHCAADIPHKTEFPNYEAYHHGRFTVADYQPEGYLVALAGEQWVGMTIVEFRGEEPRAYNAMTGVMRPFRGRGLAQALKLVAVRCARHFEMDELVTINDADNKPMLAINRKMGYRPQTGFYAFLKKLDHSGEDL
ncbi:MAG: GNAT family N-acetyltransferase [Anaerolineales bacterium]|nr:GNAT family N-acetyltransferase [Anaerolineales bacterium]